MNWYYASQGKRVGPVEDTEFEALVETGAITQDTLVWNETLSQWTPYGALEQKASSPKPQPQPSEQTQESRERPTLDFEQKKSACSECGNLFAQDDMIRYQNVWVCANCKPIFVQKLKEGAALSTEVIFAGFWERFAAKFLDGLIQGVVNAVFSFALGITLAALAGRGREDGVSTAITVLAQLLKLAIAAAYTTFFVGKYGATPGKMALGLKVVTSSEGEVSYARALGRYFAEWLSGITLTIGYLISIWDDEKRTLHDRICDTRVIKNKR